MDEQPSIAPLPPSPPAPRRLRRSRDDRAISGVCGGLAVWLGVSPTLVRAFFALLILGNGIGGAIYLLLWLVVPPEGPVMPHRLRDVVRQGGGEIMRRSWEMQEEAWQAASEPTIHSIKAIGIGLLVVGGVSIASGLNLPYIGALTPTVYEPWLMLFGGAVLLWGMLRRR